MKTQIRLILSTLALTFLIWIIADRAGHESTTITVPVRIAPADPGGPWVFTLPEASDDEPGTVRVEITFRGPKSEIRRLENDYSLGGFGLTIKIADTLTPGRKERNILPDLSRLPEIRERALTVQNVSPETVKFDVDRYRTVAVEVKPEAGSFEDDLDGTPVVKPEKVAARVPESKLSEGFSLSPLPLLLEKAIGEQLDQHPDPAAGALTFTMPLRSSWPGIDATFVPDSVEVTVKLRRDSEVKRITVRPLRPMVTQDFFDGQYEIEWDPAQRGAQFDQTINVKVPIAKLDRLEEIERKTYAFVVIDDTDLPREPPGVTGTSPAGAESRTYRSWPVYFKFPDGLEGVKLVDPRPTVRFRVKKKTGPSERVSS